DDSGPRAGRGAPRLPGRAPAVALGRGLGGGAGRRRRDGPGRDPRSDRGRTGRAGLTDRAAARAIERPRPNRAGPFAFPVPAGTRLAPRWASAPTWAPATSEGGSCGTNTSTCGRTAGAGRRADARWRPDAAAATTNRHPGDGPAAGTAAALVSRPKDRATRAPANWAGTATRPSPTGRTTPTTSASATDTDTARISTRERPAYAVIRGSGPVAGPDPDDDRTRRGSCTLPHRTVAVQCAPVHEMESYS